MRVESIRFGACGLAALLLCVAACGGSSGNEQSGEKQGATGSSPPPATKTKESDGAMTVALEEENGSGQAGTAVLREKTDEAFEILIEMSPPTKFPGEAQNAHIHNVTCAEYARLKGFNEQLETVVDGLASLSDGRSRGEVGVPLAERTTGTFAINVHEQNAPYTVVACGDIPKE